MAVLLSGLLKNKGEDMKRLSFILVLLIPALLFAQSVNSSKSKKLSWARLPDGNVMIENPEIKLIVSPRAGGRLVSFYVKKTMEEMLDASQTNDLYGGWLDTFDGLWPGSTSRAYGVRSLGVSAAQDKLTLELSYNIQDSAKSRNGMQIIKRLTLDEVSPRVLFQTELKNQGGAQQNDFYYRSLFCVRPGGLPRSVWVGQQDDIDELPFAPESGTHGPKFRSAKGFVAVMPAEGKTTLVFTGDPVSMKHLDLVDKVSNTGVELRFGPYAIAGGKSSLIEYTITALSEFPVLSGSDYESGWVSSFVPQLSGTKLTVTGSVYNAGKENFTGSKWVVDLLDANLQFVANIKDGVLESALPGESASVGFTMDVGGKLKGGKNVFRLRILDTNDVELLSAVKAVSSDNVPDSGKILSVNFLWVFESPTFQDAQRTQLEADRLTAGLSNYISLMDRRPIKSDLMVSGSYLFTLSQYQPDLLERLKDLLSKKYIGQVSSGYSYPLFTALFETDIDRQIKLDRDLKSLLFGQKPTGLYMPELAYREGVLPPVLKNQITWGYLGGDVLRKAFSSVPDTDFYAPSRLVSAGFAMNLFIQDPEASEILLQRTDSALDEFFKYLVAVNEKNKDGRRVVTVILPGESMADVRFYEKLFSRIERAKWIKPVEGDEFFRSFVPIQQFMGEKVKGTSPICLDPAVVPWYTLQETRALREDIYSLGAKNGTNAARYNMALERYPEKDFSMASKVLGDSEQSLLFASQAQWFTGEYPEGPFQSATALSNVRNSDAKALNLMNETIKGVRLTLPMLAQTAVRLTEEEKEKIMKAPKGKYQIWDRMLLPEVPTSSSYLRVQFRIFDKAVGINYQQIAVIVNINDGEEMYRVPAKMVMNGSVMAELGGVKIGDDIKYWIYAQDKKGGDSISEAYSFSVDK